MSLFHYILANKHKEQERERERRHEIEGKYICRMVIKLYESTVILSKWQFLSNDHVVDDDEVEGGRKGGF